MTLFPYLDYSLSLSPWDPPKLTDYQVQLLCKGLGLRSYLVGLESATGAKIKPREIRNQLVNFSETRTRPKRGKMSSQRSTEYSQTLLICDGRGE